MREIQGRVEIKNIITDPDLAIQFLLVTDMLLCVREHVISP